MFARFPMRCPVESLHLPHIMRSRTKSFLCTGICLVRCFGSVVSFVSPDGAPPSRGFCTSEPVDGSRSGGGGSVAGGHTSRAGSGLPRLTTPLCGVPHMFPTRLITSTCQGLSTCLFHRPASSGGRPCLLAWQVSHCLTLRRISDSMYGQYHQSCNLVSTP